MTALPLELDQTFSHSSTHRGQASRRIASFYNTKHSPPPLLVACGIENVSKSIVSILEKPHVLIKCCDCLSQRHLLSKIFAKCASLLDATDSLEQYHNNDSINSLVVNLQKLFDKNQQELVLILDGVEHQRGASQTLLPAIARLGDLIPLLSVILATNSPRALPLHRSGVPCVNFWPYTRAEAISFTVADRQDLLPQNLPESFRQLDQKVLEKFYLQFAAYTYDTLIAPTSSTSIAVYREVVQKLWPKFIWPYILSEKPPGKAKSWDFTKLAVLNRSLFQSEGEDSLVDRLSPSANASTFEHLIAKWVVENADSTTSIAANSTHCAGIPNLIYSSLSARLTSSQFLKQFPVLVLVASYLASYTNPKLDILLFSRLSSRSSKSHQTRKNYQKRTTKAGLFSESTSSALKVSRKLFDAKSGIARPFTLERLIAILRAIHPQGLRNDRGISDKVYRTLAELERLRLVVCTERDRDGNGFGEEKWRVNVGREWIEEIGNRLHKGGIGVKISEYELQAS